MYRRCFFDEDDRRERLMHFHGTGIIKVFDDAKSIEKTLKFAESKNWTRCYNCNRFVEKKVNKSTQDIKDLHSHHTCT